MQHYNFSFHFQVDRIHMITRQHERLITIKLIQESNLTARQPRRATITLYI